MSLAKEQPELTPTLQEEEHCKICSEPPVEDGLCEIHFYEKNESDAFKHKEE